MNAACDQLALLAAHHRAVAPHSPIHPIVLMHASKTASAPNSSAAVLPTIGGVRLAPWANRLLHVTHVAKTGGRSVRAELLKLVKQVGGAEQCYPPFAHPSRVNIIFFRHPRAHLVSMYVHGGHSGRFQKRRAAGYPWRNGTDGLVKGIGLWASHFADGWTPVSAVINPTIGTLPLPRYFCGIPQVRV